MSCFLKVYGRVRPSASGSSDTALTFVDKTHVKVEADGKAEKLYELHRIFPCTAPQEEVFAAVAKKLVEECTEGINGTIFAYGQTGSGKTHTMLGPSDSWSDPLAKGLIPRSIEHLFDQLEKKAAECQKFSFKVNVEFVELYNEEIFDLLSSQSASKIILRDTGSDIMLAGSKSENVDNSLDLMNIVKKGWQSRRTGATAMNRDSSRSHALLIVKITTDEVIGDLRTTRTSTLNLVDLAGSERQSHTKATGDRLKEATNINSSLTVLGRCIRMLSKPSTAQSFIPYRDSHLTHILKNSLGGNSKTAVIVNMHPDRSFVNESASTLVFAEACTMIKNKVLRNEVMTGDQENSYKRAIQELRLEIEQTRTKTKEEFARRLQDAEEAQSARETEIANLKSENTELRTKYNKGLVKYLMSGDANGLPAHIEEFLRDGCGDDLVEKMRTLKLEYEASEKRCHELQEERDSNAEKIFNTTAILQTPRGKKRQSSSRNPRRETLYQPSPAYASRFDDSEAEEKLQEYELRIAHLESELQLQRNKHEKSMEDMFREQSERDNTLVSAESKIKELTAELKECNSENEGLIAKVKGAEKTLNHLLALIQSKDQTITSLTQKQSETEEKFSKELDSMRDYYVGKQNEVVSENNSQVNQLKAEVDALRKEIDTKDQSIAQLLSDLKASTVSSSEEARQLRDMLTTKDAELLEKTKESNNKTSVISQLEADVHNLRSEVPKLKAALEEQSGVINEKTKLISDLENSLSRSTTVVTEVSRLKAELKEKERLETELNKALVDLGNSQENEQQLMKQIEIHKNDRDRMFQDYQKDIRNTKAKGEEAVKDVQKSLETAQKATRQLKETSDRQRKADTAQFDKKMAELKITFAKSEKEKVEQKEEEVRRELKNAIFQSQEKYELEIVSLQKMVERLEKQHRDDSEAIKEQLGNKDRASKLNYVDNLRQKNRDLETTNAKLLQENARLRSTKDTGAARVLRSRNPV